MGRRVVAFAPGHISGYFRRVDGRNPASTGSIGAGIVIDRGVTVTMQESETTSVCVAGNETDGWLIREVLSDIGASADVFVQPQMPIGAGFGMSAAGLLAAYTAADRLVGLGYSPAGIAERAHEFEVRHGTGLGDVAAASGGGIVIRSAPGISGAMERIMSDETIYTVSLGGIPTPEVLGSPEAMERICAAFPVLGTHTLAGVMQASRAFTEKSGLVTPQVLEILHACDAEQVTASMTMLGCGVFAVGVNAPAVLGRFGRAVPLRVSRTGPVILEDSYV